MAPKNLYIGDDAKKMFESFSRRLPVEHFLAFDVFEKRHQGDDCVISRVVGYFAFYKFSALRGRPNVFVQAKTKSQLKTIIKAVRAGWLK